jgi:hypothetical protein
MVFAALVTSLSVPGATATALPLPKAGGHAPSVDIRSGDARSQHQCQAGRYFYVG